MRQILGSFLAIVGVAWIAAAAFNWEWVIKSAHNRLFLSWFGTNGTRILYAVAGIALAAFGILYATDLI